ncbi:NADH dehydrogenase [ubiquinone] 1 alpha subcomplex assembly factor 3 [Dermacentor andersoni]|uniref:NADH dehydrogenase [ubiquinone] 1 alpha subcomplex assembly factor 3 n=1 Tax=Dermacentor andersoni TaxID=34620 RepID=UPI0021552E75|nr:NADH dehydrogenase [ubiquinone] 1 alpha subcomplex assembly factor 3-like [Dermacentor andersoni]
MLARSRTLLNKALKPRLHVRWSSYEGDGKTTVSVLNKERIDMLLVDSYSTAGFRLNNGLFVVGPIALFPRSVLQWRVKSSYDIIEESFSLFTLLEPKLDVLVIGLGDSGETLDMKVVQHLKKKKIAVEMHPTAIACSTFNFLNVEDRNVAAAMIPPCHITSGAEFYLEAGRDRRAVLAAD